MNAVADCANTFRFEDVQSALQIGLKRIFGESLKFSRLPQFD